MLYIIGCYFNSFSYSIVLKIIVLNTYEVNQSQKAPSFSMEFYDIIFM